MMTKIDFIQGNTKKCFFAMVVPLMIAMYLNMAYNIVDSLWIGNMLGEYAYAALTNATPIILILTSIGMGATAGVSILISQAVGEKDKKNIESILTTSFITSMVFAVGITMILELSLPLILRMLHTPDVLYADAIGYLRIYILGYVAVFLYLYFTAVLRSFGDSMFQMIAILVSTILNAVLDPIFIMIMGFYGAAIATLLSQVICMILMIAHMRKYQMLSLTLSCFARTQVMEIIKKAIPGIMQQSLPAISTTFLTGLITTYGITVIAAYGITGKLETILLYPAMAFNMALTSIVGQCTGARRIDRVKDYLYLALKFGSMVLVVLSIAVVLFSRQLSCFFIDSRKTAEIVAQYFAVVGVGYILNTYTNCYLGSLNGLGKPTRSMLLMVLYYVMIRMPLAYVLSTRTPLGLSGIWVAILISHVVACIASVLCGSRSLSTSAHQSVEMDMLREDCIANRK